MGLIVPNFSQDIASLRADLAAEVLRNIVKDGWAGPLNMAAGIADALVDQTGIAALGGATYDGAGHFIANPRAGALIGQGVGTVIGTMLNPAYAFDGVTNAANGACAGHGGTGYSVGKAWGGTRRIVGYDYYGPNDYNPGGSSGSQNVTLALWGKVAGVDTKLHETTQSLGVSAVVNVSSGVTVADQTETTLVVTPASGNSFAAEVRFYEQAAAPSVAVQSIAFDAAATALRVVALWEAVEAATLGTDCLFDLSADNGATWAPVALSDLGKFDASTRIVGGVVAAAGAQVKWSWRTANDKIQRLHGVWLQWR